MANILDTYNPLFLAQHALIALETELGMAVRINREYQDPRDAFAKGDTISIDKPTTYTAQDAPSAPQNIEADSIQMTLDRYKDVKINLTDKERAYTGDQILTKQMPPMIEALAEQVDLDLCGLYKDVGNFSTYGGTNAVSDILAARKIQRDLKVKFRPDRMHMMIDSQMEDDFLGDDAFNQHSGAGVVGVETQMTGHLGMKYNYEIFTNQNTPSHTGGTGADLAGAVNGAHAKWAETLAIDGLTIGETFKAGDTFSIAGHSQKYAITADVTVSGGAINVGISPTLAQAVADNAVVTMDATADHSGVGLAFHRDAFGMVFAPLPEMQNKDHSAVVINEKSGFALRARVYDMPDDSEVRVVYDILYGVKTFNPNLACRMHRT